jgi:hypothetical protein
MLSVAMTWSTRLSPASWKGPPLRQLDGTTCEGVGVGEVMFVGRVAGVKRGGCWALDATVARALRRGELGPDRRRARRHRPVRSPRPRRGLGAARAFPAGSCGEAVDTEAFDPVHDCKRTLTRLCLSVDADRAW